MRIKFTDNYGKKQFLDVPDDTSEAVLEFLMQSETEKTQEHRRDRYRLERLELPDEELFHRSMQKPPTIAEIVEEMEEEPQLLKQILNCINKKCTPKQKKRFCMYTLLHIPVKKIAAWEKCSENSVRVSIRAVISILKKNI